LYTNTHNTSQHTHCVYDNSLFIILK